MDHSDFYRESQRLRRQIRVESKTEPSRMNFALRDGLQEKYLAILKRDASFSAEKEILTNMWKFCIYDKINYFKRGIKFFSDRDDFTKLEQIEMSYKKFLNEAIRLLKKLIKSFTKKALITKRFDSLIIDDMGYDENLINKKLTDEELVALADSLNICYKLFIYLGDLERYKQLIKTAPGRDFSKAANSYECACQILPKEGNAYNQFAVLSGYGQNIVSTVYHYARSLSASNGSFQTARENFKIILEKNFELFRSQFYKSRHKNIEKFIYSIKSMRLVFVSIIYCFKMALNSNENILLIAEAESIESVIKSVLDLCKEMLFSVVSDPSYDKNDKKMIKNVLFEILICALFLFGDCFSAKTKTKLTSQLLGCFLLVLEFMHAGMSFFQNLEFLIAVSVFVDFASCHDGFYKCLESSSKKSFFRTEKSQRGKFWKSFLGFASKLIKSKTIKKEVAKTQERKILPEEKELRGFHPFEKIYGCHNTICDPSIRRKFGTDLKRYQFDLSELEDYNEDYEHTKYLYTRAEKVLNFVKNLDYVKLEEEKQCFVLDKNKSNKSNKTRLKQETKLRAESKAKKISWRNEKDRKNIKNEISQALEEELAKASLPSDENIQVNRGKNSENQADSATEFKTKKVAKNQTQRSETSAGLDDIKSNGIESDDEIDKSGFDSYLRDKKHESDAKTINLPGFLNVKKSLSPKLAIFSFPSANFGVKQSLRINPRVTKKKITKPSGAIQNPISLAKEPKVKQTKVHLKGDKTDDFLKKNTAIFNEKELHKRSKDVKTTVKTIVKTIANQSKTSNETYSDNSYSNPKTRFSVDYDFNIFNKPSVKDHDYDLIVSSVYSNEPLGFPQNSSSVENTEETDSLAIFNKSSTDFREEDNRRHEKSQTRQRNINLYRRKKIPMKFNRDLRPPSNPFEDSNIPPKNNLISKPKSRNPKFVPDLELKPLYKPSTKPKLSRNYTKTLVKDSVIPDKRYSLRNEDFFAEEDSDECDMRFEAG